MKTLIDILSANSLVEDKGITLIHGKDDEKSLSFKSLYEKALQRLTAFNAAGIEQGAEIILQIHDLEEFLVTFWSGILGGLTVIPLNVRLQNAEEHLLNLEEILKLMDNPYIISDSDHNKKIPVSKKDKIIYLDTLKKNTKPNPELIYPASPGDTAFIQYSSGSTGKPRGVILTHRNILFNIQAILTAMQVEKEKDSSLSWMPLTHDMGLIGFHLAPLAAEVNHYIMPVETFIKHPLLWMEKITEHKIPITGSPDFGLNLFLSALRPQNEYQWDLSHVRMIFNGAEPIDPLTCEKFTSTLAKYNLQSKSLFPVYGLAEACLAVTFPKPGTGIQALLVDSHSLGIGDTVDAIQRPGNSQNNGHFIRLTKVGKPVPGCRVKITDDEGTLLEEGRLGHILISGKNVTGGYLKNPEATNRVFSQEGWLNTGDLGFFHKGQLVVTGRVQDLVVVKGQNFYLHDLERIAGEVEGIKRRKIAICRIPGNGSDGPRESICAFVAFRRKIETFIPLADRLDLAMKKKTGLTLKHIIPVHHLPVTTSGKQMRHVLVTDFKEGRYSSTIEALALSRTGNSEENTNEPAMAIKSHENHSKHRPKAKRLALLFPGQGSQHIGMGKDLCLYFPIANRTFDEASDLLDFDLKRLCFDGEVNELTRTENAQPALLTISVAKFRVYQQEFGIAPYMGAGHSLGEYSALVAGGALTFRDALTLVRVRGQLMRDAGESNSGSMTAITGLHKNAVEEACKPVNAPGHRVVIANYNSATQTVISGHHAALAEVSEKLAAMGGRVVPLKVSAAFHSPLMEPCAAAFEEELNKISFKVPEWPVISNVTALPYTDGESIKTLLKRQITHPIRWFETMEYMKQQGIDAALELGPKKVLRNLMSKSSRHIKVFSTNTQADLQELAELEPDDFVDKRPNPLVRFLAKAVTSINRNFDNEQYMNGVVEPYRKLQVIIRQLEEEKKEPEKKHIKECALLLKEILDTKATAQSQEKPSTQDVSEDFSSGVRSTDIAVIGIALRTAGADNWRQFWSNLTQGNDCVREIPDQRQQDIDRYLPHLYKFKLDEAGKRNKKRYLNAGYLERIDQFDYRFFRLSPKEASLLDPAQRMFLETAYEVLEDAGYAGENNENNGNDGNKENNNPYETGVYVGYSDDVKMTYFQMVSQMEPENIAMAIAGNLSSIVPTRISFFMDLTGPGLLIDTACSSSLVAIHLSCQAIRSGDCDQAIAGGVRVNLVPISHSAKVGIESSDGRTRTFDNASDGAGTGEGAAAVLLKPLSRAIADGDHIYATIKGSAMNQDGKSSGITAPRAEAQARVVEKAWKSANIDPETISYIEAHGTATRVGDPTEVEALTQAFGKYTDKKQFCGIGSVKTNIGHLFEASGIFGFIKAALALKYGVLPPLLHFNRPNDKIKFEESPLYINDKLRKWETEGFPRRAGVTAFGFSGTNCHVVLEETSQTFFGDPGGQHAAGTDKKYILPLSAKTPDTLKQLVEKYIYFIEGERDISLADMCFTAAVGRRHFNYRVAFSAGDVEELVLKLKSFHLRGQKEEFEDQTSPAHLYQIGQDPDWGAFYAEGEFRRVSLPTYPFEPHRCWLEIPEYEELSSKPLEGKLFFDMEWFEEPLKESSIEEENAKPDGSVTLVVNDQLGFGLGLAESFRQRGETIIDLTYGKTFAQVSEYSYKMDGSEGHYEKLFNHMQSALVKRVIFLATLVKEKRESSFKGLQQSQRRGAYQLFHLTKMLMKHFSTEKIEYIVIADYANHVLPTGTIIKPSNAPLMGLTYAIDRECENFTGWFIDIDKTTTLEQIIAEIDAGKQYRAAAYRDNRRYIERFLPVDMEDQADEKIEIKPGGVYLVTGGTGGIGLEMGKALAAKAQGVRIALVNRTPLPDSKLWDEILYDEEDKRVCQKLSAIREMQARGADVQVYSADCANRSQMKTIIDDLKQKYGKINGIIHGAGVEGEGLLVRKSEKKFTNVLNPKVAGTWILDRLTQSENLDFFVMFSTVATFLMNPGQTDYTAANAYLDAFAEYRTMQGKKTLAVNWVTWKETGMAVNFNANFDIIFKAIPTAQAIESFDLALNKRVRKVLIGELNLDSKLINLLKNAQFRLSGPIRSIIESPDNPLKSHPGEESRKRVRKVKLTGRSNEKYSKSELLVARIWGEVLGFDQLKIDDNFYELGGDSILATQVVNRINRENNLKIALIEIFNYETINDLAKYVESLL